MVRQELQKQLAVGQHSLQAGEFVERYRQLESDPYQNCFAYSRHRLDAWIGRCLPPPGAGPRLLDVGCGTGHHMARLRARGFEVAGVDGSEEMLREARALNPGAGVHHADVESLPFPDASFDVVLCVEVLRYLPDPAGCIREMARVLRPGGVCLATAAPLLSLNGYWLVNRLAHRLPLGKLVRLKQFFTTPGRLRRQFIGAGFDPPAVHGVYCGPINWLERLAPTLLPGVLRRWEDCDSILADLPVLRHGSNMFLVHAVRRG